MTEHEINGVFKCPKCQAQFGTETELKKHFSENPNCDEYAKYLLAKIKYEF